MKSLKNRADLNPVREHKSMVYLRGGIITSADDLVGPERIDSFGISSTIFQVILEHWSPVWIGREGRTRNHETCIELPVDIELVQLLGEHAGQLPAYNPGACLIILVRSGRKRYFDVDSGLWDHTEIQDTARSSCARENFDTNLAEKGIDRFERDVDRRIRVGILHGEVPSSNGLKQSGCVRMITQRKLIQRDRRQVFEAGWERLPSLNFKVPQ